MASVTKEPIGTLHDKLTVKVSRDDYYPAFEKAVKDYSRKVNLPGFRKGMVPAGMIKKMYGSSIFHDEVIKTVEKQIQEYLENEKPAIFAQPLPLETEPRNLDMTNPTDYDFPFEIGLKPEVQIADLAGARPTLYKVTVTDPMVDEEVEKLVTKYGNLQDAETVTDPDNVLNVVFQESDPGGNPLADAASTDDSILLKYFSEKMQSELKGKKKDDWVVLQLQDAFGEKEREWILTDLGLSHGDPAIDGKYFRMTITKIGLVEKRELNEAFFSQVFPGRDLSSAEAFREALREQMQQQWDAASRSQLHDQLYHLLLEAPLSLPEAFLKRWLTFAGEKAKTTEEAEREYPAFAGQLKWSLISDKIVHEHNIGVTPEEIRSHMRAEILQYFGQANPSQDDFQWMDSYIDRMMADRKQLDSSYQKILTDKLFRFLESQVTPVEKPSTPEELMALQHHHHH